MSNKLENNKNDLLASITKSAVGIVPLAGPLLSELVSNIIPNQRIDRLTKYVKELDEKISKIPLEIFKKNINNENFIDLIEEGFVQASRAITDERRKYIASIIVNGITSETIELQESKFLLKILQELNDIEIIWLRYFLDPAMGGDTDFREKHKRILAPVPAHIGSDKEILQKSALQKNYRQHLERLGLILGKIKFDKSMGKPEFDRFTGQAKISYTETTRLGKMLLEQLGLMREI